jgi:4-amino-4-deoxy-L-arabinose transferase-like glycosyltransferase
LALFGWIRIFGTGEYDAVRSLSTLFYLASVFALYRWGVELGGKRVGAIAAAVYMTTPLSILVSHFARMYALLSLLSILSTWLYWRGFVDGKRSRSNLALFAVVNALGTLTHIWFFFILFAEGVHWLAMRRRHFLEFSAVMTASIVPYAVLWMPTLFRQLGKSSEAAAWLRVPTPADLMGVFFLYSAVAILPLAAAVLQAVMRRVRPFPWTRLVALAAPFALSYVKPVFYSRFTIVGVHLFALAVAGCVARVSSWQVPVLVSAIVLAYYGHLATQPKLCDARMTADYLAAHASAADSAVFTSLSRPPVDHYLRKIPIAPFAETSFPAEIDAHPGYEGAWFAPDRQGSLQQEAEELALRLHQRHGRVFLFHGYHAEIDAVLERALSRQFRRIDSETVNCGDGYCYYNKISVYE